MDKQYKTPLYIRTAIANYKKRKLEADPLYADKLRDYQRVYMQKYRKLQKEALLNTFRF